MAAIEQTYRYRGASEWDQERSRPAAYLATSGGPGAHPYFFSGFVGQARRDAQLMMTVGRVASSRFHVPSAMVAAAVRSADPVVTCDGDRLRFEAFSACNGVYARLDLERLDGEVQGVGTTNVDFNPRFQNALAAVRAADLVHLAVGLDEVRLARLGGTVVERKVALPERWLRGFAEVAVAQERMVERFALDGAATRRFLGEVARGTRKVPVWVGAAGSGLKIGPRLPADESIPVDGLDRLALLADHARYATSLRVFQEPAGSNGETASGWELSFGDARLTIVVSPARHRGFSGEGSVLMHLTGATVTDDADRVAARLTATRHQSLGELIAGTGLREGRARSAVAVLGAQGAAGFDRGLERWFVRELPFDVEGSARLHPRLRDAQRLVEKGAVQLHDGDGDRRAASVGGDHGRYNVTVAGEDWTCGCQWFRDHGTTRGPCKHVLAVLLSEPGNGEGAA